MHSVDERGQPVILGLIGSPSFSAEHAQCTLRFDASEPFFAGHFPGHPIVPGMIMLGSLAALGRAWSGADITGISESKFRHEVAPGSDIKCLVRRDGLELCATATVAGETVLEAFFTLTEKHP